jgi:signal transduction histidine kinase
MKQLLFFCLLTQIGFAQTSSLDSLKWELADLRQRPAGYSRDTLTFKTLKVIMDLYTNVNLDSSVHYNNLMLALCQSPKLRKERVYAYQFAAYLQKIKGDYYESIRLHYEALTLAEAGKLYFRIAYSKGALASAYYGLKEYTKAIAHCKQGLSVLHKLPSDYVEAPIFGKRPRNYIEASVLNALWVVYYEQGKLDSALAVTKAIYKLARESDDLWHQAQGLHIIGRVYMAMGDQTEPFRYFQQALALTRKLRDLDLEGSILLHIADVYIQRKEWKQALAYCQRARQDARQIGNSSIMTESDEQLYKIYKQTGALANALKAHEDFMLMKDSLAKDKNQQRINLLTAQYDNIKKTNQTKLLKQKLQLLDEQNQNQQLAQVRNNLLLGILFVLLITALVIWNNRQLQAKNRALIRSNEAIKEALFKGQTIERKRVALELHDNLSSLLSAINMSMQAINPQHLSPPAQAVYQNVRQLIQNAYAEVRNISHNILPAELEREGLGATLTTLVGQLNQNLPQQFRLTLTGLEQRVPIEIEFNVYSIVFELVNNAIKHANATTISIDLLRTSTGIDVSVADDGVGLGQHHDKRGVGLQNIQTRLDSLGGTFAVDGRMDKGTRINIKIPIETVGVDGNVLTP